jgi:hypothetical protein
MLYAMSFSLLAQELGALKHALMLKTQIEHSELDIGHM